MFCYKCGTELPDEALICSKCGTRTVKSILALPQTAEGQEHESSAGETEQSTGTELSAGVDPGAGTELVTGAKTDAGTTLTIGNKTNTEMVPYKSGDSTAVGPYLGKGRGKITKKMLVIMIVSLAVICMAVILAVIIHKHNSEPKNTVWSEKPKGKYIDAKDLPMAPQLETALSASFAWCYSGSTEKTRIYDSRKAAKCDIDILDNSLNFICNGMNEKTRVYPVSKPTLFSVNSGDAMDPKGKAAAIGGRYYGLEAESAEWMAVNIFNASAEDVKKIAALANEKTGAVYGYYKDGGRYILTTDIDSNKKKDISLDTIKSAMMDGRFYYLAYSIKVLDSGTEEGTYDMYAVMELKEAEGKKYWSFYYFSNLIPAKMMSSPKSDAGVKVDEIIAESCRKYVVKKKLAEKEPEFFEVTKGFDEENGAYYTVHLFDVMYDKGEEGHTATVAYYRVFPDGRAYDLWDISDEEKNVPIFISLDKEK
ncbi:MAG: zinc ribbon domain-containing protein [Eubacterium sp.]|nr:zinc ribbon domain-containing protein [Eubacterium sp.]